MGSEEPCGPGRGGLQAEAGPQECLLNEWEIRDGLSQGRDMFSVNHSREKDM